MEYNFFWLINVFAATGEEAGHFLTQVHKGCFFLVIISLQNDMILFCYVSSVPQMPANPWTYDTCFNGYFALQIFTADRLLAPVSFQFFVNM